MSKSKEHAECKQPYTYIGDCAVNSLDTVTGGTSHKNICCGKIQFKTLREG